MMLELGQKYLITTTNWFYGPDGSQYKAVHGTFKGTSNAEQTLGISTNRNSTNWYAQIGAMIIAGCQIHYIIQTNEVSTEPGVVDVVHNGGLTYQSADNTRIFVTD